MPAKLPFLQLVGKPEIAKSATDLELPLWQHRDMKKENHTSPGFRIRSRREELGWTQESLAEKSGIGDKTQISKIESGRIRLTDHKLRSIAKALNCKPSDIIDDDDRLESPEQEDDANLFHSALQVMSETEKEEVRSYLRMRLTMSKARGS